jgi:hypothetical protein
MPVVGIVHPLPDVYEGGEKVDPLLQVDPQPALREALVHGDDIRLPRQEVLQARGNNLLQETTTHCLMLCN